MVFFKTVLIYPLTITIIFFVLYVFIIIPQRRRIMELSEEYKYLTKEVSEISSRFRNVAQERSFNYTRELDRVRNMFTSSDEDIVKLIYSLSKEYKLQILSFSKIETKPLVYNNQQVSIDKSRILKRVFEISMRGSFKDVVNFITALRDNGNIFFTVEELSIRRYSPEILDVEMEINSYLQEG